MIVCNRCGKENQDHYKFCLGCGAELVADAPAPSAPGPAAAAAAAPSWGSVSTPMPRPVAHTPPSGVSAPGPNTATLIEDETMAPTEPPESLDVARAPAPTPAPGPAVCSNCGLENPAGFAFCGNCGTRLREAEPPADIFSAEHTPIVMPAPEAEITSRPATAGVYAHMSLIRPDGSEGGVHDVVQRDAMIGRGAGPLFASDAYLSPQHVRLVFDEDRVLVEDQDSLNGVFIRINTDEPLEHRDIFRIGQELLRFDAIGTPELTDDGTEILGSPNPGYWGRLSLIVGRGADGSAFPLMGEDMVLGRERGDILFSDDGYVSGTHAKLSITDRGVFLSDLGSSNGTFIRLKEPRYVPYGAFVLMGQQLFRVDPP